MKGYQLGSQQAEKWEDRWAEDLILAEDARIRQNTKILQVTSLTSHRLHIYNKFCRISTRRGKKLLQCVSIKQRMIRKQPHNKVAWVQSVQEDDPLSHINDKSLPADISTILILPGRGDPPICLQNVFLPNPRDTQLSQEEIHWRHCSSKEKKIIQTEFMEHGPQQKWQTLAKINFTTETMFSSLKFKKQKTDAYLQRYSKDTIIFKGTVFIKI